MANEPIYDVASPDHKNKLCSAQTAVEARLLPMGGVTISKVLSYSANCFVGVTDVFTGEVRVAGKVSFKVLFLSGDGDVKTMETNVEFTDKITCDNIAGKPEILSRVPDTDIISLSADEIKLAAIVEMDLFDNVSTRLKFLRYGGEDVYTREEKLDYTKLVTKVSDAIGLDDQIQVVGDKLLLAESIIVLHNATAGAEIIVCNGEIISNIVTTADGEINNYRLVTPFQHEVPADGTRSDCDVQLSVKLKSVKTAFSFGDGGVGEDEGENSGADHNTLNLQFEAELSGFVYCTDSTTLVSDAFSIQSQLSMTVSEVTLTNNCRQKNVLEKIEGTITLAADMPACDKILAITAAKLSVANSFIDGENLILEGTVNAAVIYYSAETGTKNSIDAELPFSLSTACDQTGDVIAAHGEVTEITARIRRAGEIDLKSEIVIATDIVTSSKARLVSELSIGESIGIPEAAISLHISRQNETLWDVAKALKTTPELILLQNPELQLPLKSGQRVIIYRHLSTKK